MSAMARELACRWRTPMLRYARLHLRQSEDAEDAVQDALHACLTHPPQPWPDDPRPWLFGVLRHKISDLLRQRLRHGSPMAAEDDDALDATLFDARGHWAAGISPTRWHLPDAHLDAAQLFALVDACVERLPPQPARVFSLRVLLEWDAGDILQLLGLTQATYWQALSRARKQLQMCLAQLGYDAKPSP